MVAPTCLGVLAGSAGGDADVFYRGFRLAVPAAKTLLQGRPVPAQSIKLLKLLRSRRTLLPLSIEGGADAGSTDPKKDGGLADGDQGAKAVPTEAQRVGLVTLHKLQWLVATCAAFFLGLLFIAELRFEPHLSDWRGRVLFFLVAAAGVLGFTSAVFVFLRRIQDRVERQNAELLALHQAGLDINSELSLETVLQKVVDTARALLGARYGALAVYREDGVIQAFITSGLGEAARIAIGQPPEGKGILGLVLREGERLRLPELSNHPASIGFPAHHPPMSTLVAVPVLAVGPYRGNLYLAEKIEGQPFSSEDEEALARFATQAALAIGNAHLHGRTRELATAEERLRIAHEMHDGLAQVLAYVNTKAQAAKEYLKNDRKQEAAEQLDELAAAARGIYGDVREAILGLRLTASPSRPLAETLREYVERWQDSCDAQVELDIDSALRLSPGVELHLVRVVQEALGNIRKHSEARRVRLSVRQQPAEVKVEVVDDGVGFDPQAVRRGGFPRFGLNTMRERVASTGGTIEIVSQPGAGTRVLACFPLTAGPDPPAEAKEHDAPANRR